MKKLLLIALSTFAASAHAWEPTYYAGSSVASWQYQSSTSLVTDSAFSLYSAEALAGITLTPYTSIEGRVGFGLNTGRHLEDDGSGRIEVEMPYYGSVYFRPHITNDRASLYGLLGMTTISTESTPADTTMTEEEVSAISYGIGVSFVVKSNIDVTAEWKKLINADDFDIRGGSLGFVYRF